MAQWQNELLTGGYQPKTISGTSEHTLTKCSMIVPDGNGCVIASLKRSDIIQKTEREQVH